MDNITECKRCGFMRKIHIGNVCNSCHAAFELMKGKLGAATVRVTKNGFYCLRCKFIVAGENPLDINEKIKSYCRSCRSALATISKRKLPKVDSEADEVDSHSRRPAKKTKRTPNPARRVRTTAKKTKKTEAEENEVYSFIGSDSEGIDLNDSEYEEPVFKPTSNDESTSTEVPSGANLSEFIAAQTVQSALVSTMPNIEAGPMIQFVGTCQHCNHHTVMQFPTFFLQKN